LKNCSVSCRVSPLVSPPYVGPPSLIFSHIRHDLLFFLLFECPQRHPPFYITSEGVREYLSSRNRSDMSFFCCHCFSFRVDFSLSAPLKSPRLRLLPDRLSDCRLWLLMLLLTMSRSLGSLFSVRRHHHCASTPGMRFFPVFFHPLLAQLICPRFRPHHAFIHLLS